MIISWEAHDGYVGMDRPQKTKVSDDEILSCDTVEEAIVLIEGAVQDDFEQKVAPSYDFEKIKTAVEKLFESKPKEEETGNEVA